MVYLYDVVQEDAGRDQGPWTPSPVPGSEIFLVIRDIVFSISAILTCRVTNSASAAALDYISFLSVALSFWVINDVACFTFDDLVCPVAVETPRKSPPDGYTSSPVREALHQGWRHRLLLGQGVVMLLQVVKHNYLQQIPG